PRSQAATSTNSPVTRSRRSPHTLSRSPRRTRAPSRHHASRVELWRNGYVESFKSRRSDSAHRLGAEPGQLAGTEIAIRRIGCVLRCHHVCVTDGRVHYARNGDVRLAYRVFGESGPTVVWVPGWVVSNVDTIDEPGSPYARFFDLVDQGIQFVVW